MTHTHQYELMVILDPAIDERQVAPKLDGFLKVITADGGTVENVDVWGKRRLAYEIQKKNDPHCQFVNEFFIAFIYCALNFLEEKIIE